MTELIYATNESCGICNASSLEEILHLGDQPPANSLYKPSDQAPLNVPLRLMFCKDCLTVQLGETVDPTYLFDRYVWVTGTSKIGASYTPALELPIINSAFFKSVTKYSNLILLKILHLVFFKYFK